MKINTLFRDRYFIADTLGCGGMGVVYLAFDIKSCQFVAIKSLFAELASVSEYRQRFLREHRIYKSLAHPHIVRYIDGDTEAARPWVALEYVSGRALKSFIRGPNRRLPVLRVLRFLVALAGALGAAHDKKIVHRDIKPTNLIVDQDESVKLIDFGVADANDSLVRTESGIVLGTRCYASPEQNRGHTVDGRADIYSLGVTFWELLTGQGLFRSSTVFGVVSAQIAKSFLPPSTYNEDVPKALDELVLSCLEPLPNNRPQSAKELAKAADAIRHNLFQREETSTAEYQFDLCQKALELFYAKKSKEAEALLVDMAESANHGPAQFLLGKIAWQQKLKFQALEKVRNAIELDSKNELYKVDFARLLLSFRMHNQAREFVAEAAAQKKHSPLIDALQKMLRLGRSHLSVESEDEETVQSPGQEIAQHQWVKPNKGAFLAQSLEKTQQALFAYRESLSVHIGLVDFRGFARPQGEGFPLLELRESFPKIGYEDKRWSLSELSNKDERIVVTGPSGSGLTSMLRGLAFEKILQVNEAILPIYVSISDYIKVLNQYPDCTLEAFAICEAAQHLPEMVIALWRQLRTGRLLWLVDDMVDKSCEHFLHLNHQLLGLFGKVIVTSHFPQEALHAFLPCEALPFDDDERSAFLKLWTRAFACPGSARDLAAHLQEAPNLCSVFNRPQLLAIAAQAPTMFEPRDYPRNTSAFLQCHLERLAKEVQSSAELKSLQALAKGQEVDSSTLAAWSRIGVLKEDGRTFRHAIFEKFLKAKEFVSVNALQGMDITIKEMAQSKHIQSVREVLLLAAPMLDEESAVKLLQHLIYDGATLERTLGRNLRLSAELIASGAPVEKALLSRLVAKVAAVAKGATYLRTLLGIFLWSFCAHGLFYWDVNLGTYFFGLFAVLTALAMLTGYFPKLRMLITLPARLWFVKPTTVSFVKAAAALGKRAEDSLRQALVNSTNPKSQVIAATASKFVASEELTTSLLEVVEDSSASETVRKEAAEAVRYRKLSPNTIKTLFRVVRTLSAPYEVRFAAAHSMTALGGEETVNNVLEGLIHQDHKVRTITAAACANLPSRQDLVSALSSLVNDRYPEVRLAVVETLGTLGGEEVLSSLVKAMGDHNDDVRQLAKEKLIAQKERAIAPLLDFANNEQLDTEVRIDAIACLAEIKLDEVAKHLESLSTHEDHHVRTAAILGLRHCQKKASISTVVKGQSDYRDEVRRACAMTLASYPGEEAYEPLVRALQDNNRDVRRAAIESLLQVGVANVNETLLKTLADKDWEVRRTGTLALGRLFDVAIVPHLIEVLEDKIKAVQLAAIKSLAQIGDERAIVPLMELLVDSDGEVVWAAGVALSSFGELVPVDELGGLLGARDVSTRTNAIRALGATRRKDAIAYLAKALDDPSSDVRTAAIEALSPILTKTTLELLIKALSDEKAKVRFCAVEALGFRTKNPIAIDGLIGMLRDKDEKVRATAALWLGRSKNRQAVPFITPLLEDTAELVRLQAIYALGEIGCLQSLQALAAMLGDWQIKVRSRAIAAIGQIGKESKEQDLVKEAMNLCWWHLTDDSEVAKRAFAALEECATRFEELRCSLIAS